jgi:predicted RecB family nuclease
LGVRQAEEMGADDDIVLGGYPAKWCPRRTHNDHSPDSPEPLDVSPELQKLFDLGNEFEATATAALLAALGGRMVLIEEFRDRWDDAIRATTNAMDAGVDVIVNGRLPKVGNRAGAPDVLVRAEGGYLPVDIKGHGLLKALKRSTLVHSTLGDPTDQRSTDGYAGAKHRPENTLQLAHYTRMLESMGYHPGGRRWGGIIGTDDHSDLVGERLGIVWYDLDEAIETTYSASSPTRKAQRSPVERYDHEFAFRLKVAEAARRGEELVRPIGIAECGRCPWVEYCTSLASPDDASFAILAPQLDAREWLFLARHGGNTIAGLAALDAAVLVDEYKAQAVGRQSPEQRLRTVIDQARMTRDGIDIEPFDPVAGWPQPPAADIEIDFDIEWDRDMHVYQWGIRIRDGQDDATSRYDPVISFDTLDPAAHEALADEFTAKLRALLADADADGRSVAIFHWTMAETSRARAFPELAGLLNGRTVDLYEWVRAHFRVRGTYSIKNVAPMFGFEWGVEDPGGFGSMDKIEQARTRGPHGDAAREWCLAYNESDVAAQAAVRDGLLAKAADSVASEPLWPPDSSR